jgi:hypothetical protein
MNGLNYEDYIFNFKGVTLLEEMLRVGALADSIFFLFPVT